MPGHLSVISFNLTKRFFGVPDPFIPSKSIVVMVSRDERVSHLGIYEEATDEDPFHGFWPVGEEYYNENVRELIRLCEERHKNPEMDVVIFIHPDEYRSLGLVDLTRWNLD
jgi:hypothetical protein